MLEAWHGIFWELYFSDPVNCISATEIVFLEYESRAKREVSWTDRGSIRDVGGTTREVETGERVLKESESLLSLPLLYFLFQLHSSTKPRDHFTFTFTCVQIAL